MTSFLIRRRGRGFWLPWIRQTQENNRIPFHNKNTETRLMTSFLNRQRGRGSWLPWIRQTQENNRTPFHNNTFSFALQYLSNMYWTSPYHY